MRALPSAVAIIGTFSILACSRSAAPTAPSPALSMSTSASAERVTTASPDPPPIEPLLARLNLVSNDLDSANHQLLLFLLPSPPPIIPPTPILPQNALNFYVRANGVLGNISAPDPPPITPQWNAALNGIIGQANTTLGLLNPSCDTCVPQGSPIFQDILSQAVLTKALAGKLLTIGG